MRNINHNQAEYPDLSTLLTNHEVTNEEATLDNSKSTTSNSDESLLDAYSRAVIEAAEKISPSVVYIEVSAEARRGQRRNPRHRPAERDVSGTGSGFVFTPD